MSTLNFTVTSTDTGTKVDGKVEATGDAMESVILALINGLAKAKMCHQTEILKRLTIKLMLLAMEEKDV